MLTHVLFFLLGLGALVLGAEALVRGASKIALSLGISPLVVGLTIVAMAPVPRRWPSRSVPP